MLELIKKEIETNGLPNFKGNRDKREKDFWKWLGNIADKGNLVVYHDRTEILHAVVNYVLKADRMKSAAEAGLMKIIENNLYIPNSTDEAYDAVIATLKIIRGNEKTHIFPIFVPKIDKSKVGEALLTKKITNIGSVELGYDEGYSSEEPVTVNFSEGIIVLSDDYYSDTTRYGLEKPTGSFSPTQTKSSASNSTRRFDESLTRRNLFRFFLI